MNWSNYVRKLHQDSTWQLCKHHFRAVIDQILKHGLPMGKPVGEYVVEVMDLFQRVRFESLFQRCGLYPSTDALQSLPLTSVNGEERPKRLLEPHSMTQLFVNAGYSRPRLYFVRSGLLRNYYSLAEIQFLFNPALVNVDQRLEYVWNDITTASSLPACFLFALLSFSDRLFLGQ